MRHILVILLGLIFLSGCEETGAPISDPLTLEEQLRDVMQMPLATGTGKVVRSISYCCDPKRPFITLDFYYPVGGEFSYRIQKGADGDTLEISLQRYENEKLRYIHSFRYRSGMLPEWMNTADYIYDSEGKLIERYATSAEKPRYLAVTYRYDEKGRLISMETSAGNGVESQNFAYDQQDRIAREWSAIKTDKEVELNFMFYRYEADLLVAKEASQNGRLEGPRQDWYRYVYDQKGRLIAQFEFDPYFSFQQKNYAEFFYE
ncbi:hypothetical protein [Algoriphagus sp.]|uniref:hypothetical protein n=1 Tax=Algoriphagus sp. TaxID=1872435 RepID=UPI00391D631C